jgi:hypothetical protein
VRRRLPSGGAGLRLAELAGDRRTWRESLLETLDEVHMACEYEYGKARTDDERDAILTLRAVCYDIKCDLDR